MRIFKELSALSNDKILFTLILLQSTQPVLDDKPHMMQG